MNAIELANDVWHLQLLPQWGGRIGALRAAGLDLLVPISATRFDPLAWPRGGAYPLIPYSNRLRDARLRFDGRTYALPAHPAAQPHTLHGVSHTLSWQLEALTSTEASMACEYAGEHWPWPVRAEQHIQLQGNTLHLRIRLVNQGDRPMPGGIGLHPYFKRHSGMRVQWQAGREWSIDDQYLATGSSRQLQAPCQLQADTQGTLALYHSQWDGLLQIDYPQGCLSLHASAPLEHFVAFAPADAPYLCLEPVSHLADAFNSLEQDWASTGARRIEPGAALEASLRFTWQPSL